MRTGAAAGFAAAAGAACGVGWSKFLERLQRPQFAYMLTLAVLFLLFSLAEFIRGNGAMAALVFGLILGNYKRFPSLFGSPLGGNTNDTTIRWYHGELAFFVRTFFFVYIGLIFTADPLGPKTLLLCLLIFGAIVASRYLAAQLLVWGYRDRKSEQMIFWLMTARGLAAAVLAGADTERAAEPLFVPRVVDARVDGVSLERVDVSMQMAVTASRPKQATSPRAPTW